MKLLADENIDASLVARLRDAGHEVLSVAEMDPGIPDELVLERANDASALLVTEDKDFGELAFRLRLINHGVILIRMAGQSAAQKGNILTMMIEAHDAQLEGAFTVVTPGLVRIRKG